MNTHIEVKQLTVQVQKQEIISDVNLSLDKGDILGLVGPSGCGKTTLLNTLAGFYEQSGGSICIQGSDPLSITTNNLLPPERRNIGMIFQDYALFPHLTVAENICFGISKLSKEEQTARTDELLSLLALPDFANRFPHELSGGQQQRVAIARALAPRPSLLLLDEPFSNIDARLRNELMIEIRQLLKRLGMTAIFVTHNKDEVFTFADKIAVMHQGRILQFGMPAEVCNMPLNWQVADFLQLGSWLPVQLDKGSSVCNSAIGQVSLQSCQQITPATDIPTENNYNLLIKPFDIVLIEDEDPNVIIEHVGVTEQGYHYLLKSINTHDEYQFRQLSFYSVEFYTLGQQLTARLNAKSFLIYQL